MKFRTVCVSFTQESEGDNIGQVVARELGFRYVSDEILSKAASLAGVEKERVAAAEQTQPLVERLLEMLSAAQSSVEAMIAGGGRSRAEAPASDELRSTIREAIVEIGKAGGAVIVAHGASMALATDLSALRVLVTAPEETRIDRLVERTLVERAEASAKITESDDARREYFRNFYRLLDEAPTHYDLVLNTERIPRDLAVRMILTAARS
jgi:hypothetical protein